MNWTLADTLPADTAVDITIPLAAHPRFRDALVRHAVARLEANEAWRDRALSRLRSAVEQSAELRRLDFSANAVRYDPDRGFLAGPATPDRKRRRRASKVFEKALPAGWVWTRAGASDDHVGRIALSDEGRQLLGQAEARALTLNYVATGKLPDGFISPAGVPQLVVRALSITELRAVEADAGVEPQRPGLPTSQRLDDDPDQAKWRAWLAWKTRRDQGLLAFGWSEVIIGGQRVPADEFLERLKRGSGGRAAMDVYEEATQHIYRLSYLPAALGKECAAPSGSATAAPGGASA